MKAERQKAEDRRQKAAARLPTAETPSVRPSPACAFRPHTACTSRHLLAFGGWLLAVSVASLRAATNTLANPEEMPALRPAKPEIPPGFWEQHGVLVTVAGLAILLGVILLWKILSRSRPPVVAAPAEIARAALQPLRPHEENPALLAKVSSVLRKYFIAAFDLPIEEFTNHELCRQLAAHPKVDPRLSEAVTELLQAMEHRRFRPEVNTAEASTVETALKLIDQAEAQLIPPPEGIDPATRQT